ncbi:hypothetical protein ACOZ4L_16680 (plasmid) [Haloplanus ruber]|uniref:Uncharacterized protein n=1 Tax=Haloplanus ruber TaxID=869892 RepID=A0ABD6D2I1_9EURY|nr:hypothetical protein [Haloplanus ruber]
MIEISQPPAHEEIDAATAELEALAADDTLQFEPHDDSEDDRDGRDAIQIWGVEHNGESLVVNLSDPDVPVHDWDRTVEYLHLTRWDKYFGRPAARIEQFNGVEATHVGYVRGIDPDGETPTVVWEPVR